MQCRWSTGLVGQSGLNLIFGWKYINIIKIVIRMAGELESDSVALERVREYEDLPQVPQQKTKRTIKQKTSDSGGRLGVWGALGWELAINRRDQVWWVRDNSYLIFVQIDLCQICHQVPTWIALCPGELQPRCLGQRKGEHTCSQIMEISTGWHRRSHWGRQVQSELGSLQDDRADQGDDLHRWKVLSGTKTYQR